MQKAIVSRSLRSTNGLMLSGTLALLPGLLLLAWFQPVSPDLIAQLSRASISRTTEGATWWTSWYGGMVSQSYSVIMPTFLRVWDVWTLGIASAVVSVLASAKLLQGTQRAHLAVVLVAVISMLNLASGRITFAVGAALVLLSLWAFRSERKWIAAGIGVLSWLASPLAGLFLLLIILSVIWQKEHRLKSFLIAGSIGATGIAVALAFPSSGRMPMENFELVFVLIGSALILLTYPSAMIVRIVLVFVASSVVFYAVGTPVGHNIMRFPMLFAAPALMAAPSLRPRFRTVIVALLVLWPTVNTALDLMWGSDRSSSAEFYAPLLEQLSKSGTPQHRVEVVDPITHGPALYVAFSVPLARGWERQTDMVRNAALYDKSLDARSYREWLDSTSVKWVALPNARLDYSSQNEAALITGGLPYLHLIWKSDDWQLFEVQNPTPIANGVASVSQVTPRSIELSSLGSGEGTLNVQWFRGLELLNVDKTQPAGTVRRLGDKIWYSVPAAGTYELTG